MNKRDFLKGMVATAAGLMVPAHALAESKYEFRQRVAGLKPVGASGKPTPIASDGGVDWYGEVSADELIDGIALAQLIGLTAGTAQHSNAGWLHVGLDGQELLIAKRTFRNSITWNHLGEVNAVWGDRIVTIKDRDYRIRLPKGANSNPIATNTGWDIASSHGSEWNRIFYRITDENYSNSNNSKASEEPFEHFAYYSENDLALPCWCQEASGAYRVTRGNGGVSRLNRENPAGTISITGWRPVLERI